jgi:WD40 repeat protein
METPPTAQARSGDTHGGRWLGVRLPLRDPQGARSKGFFTGSSKHDRVLKGHPAVLTSLAFSPDGALLPSGDQAFLPGGPGLQQDLNSIRLWESQSGKLIGKLLAGSVQQLASSHIGSLLAAGILYNDVNMRVFKVKEQDLLGLFHFGRPVRSGDFSPTDTYLAAGLEDGSVCLIGASGQRIQKTLAQTPTDRATGKIWNVCRQTQHLAWPPEHRGRLTSVAFSPDGSRLASASVDGSNPYLPPGHELL